MKALEKKRNKDNRGALHAMKSMKMHEKELNKIDGMKILLEQQKFMLESSQFDGMVIDGMQTGATALEQLQKKLDIDAFDKIKDDIDDQMAQKDEIDQFFISQTNVDMDDELMGELDALEEEMALD